MFIFHDYIIFTQLYIYIYTYIYIIYIYIITNNIARSHVCSSFVKLFKEKIFQRLFFLFSRVYLLLPDKHAPVIPTRIQVSENE